MKPESLLHADLLDIVFENRNKDYGAYVLRKQYPAALQTALIFVMALVAIMSIWFFNSGKTQHLTGLIFDTGKEIDSVILYPPPPLPDQLTPPPQATIQHVSTIIANDGTDTIPTIEALDQPVQIGTDTRSGDTSDLTGPVANTQDTASGIGNAPPSAEVEPTIYRSPQEMPEFPGGKAALQRFLLKHLRVPDEDLEPGTRITVEAQFIVSENGNITGIQIMRSGGEPFNKEVLRVLNKMPVWKPGRQNGMQVPVYFKLPVTFQAE
jgi:protein TonB